MNMKLKAMLLGLSIMTALPVCAQKPVYLDTNKPIEERVKDALNRMTLEEKVRMIHAQSKFSSAGVPRLGIPEVWATDGPHGIRPEVLWDEWNQAGWTNDSCIAYPALTCLAATWNPKMSYLYGKSIGEEARYRKKDILLGPGVNIYRTPLNGRNFEYMGEDPYLSSIMVVPYIKGVQENGVAACVKHYALNNQEFNRHTTNVEVSVDNSGSTEKLIATVNGALATDEASAINTGMLGGLAFNLQGADLIAREGMEAAVRSAQLDNNHAVFAALTRSSLDYGAVDVDGTNMLAGLAWRSTTGAGSLTYGVFAEHGDGSYDTYANINGISLHGEGDTDYTGGGILARMDFNGSETGHGYLEASGRVGNADTDYTNSGLRDAYGRAASYSTDGTYYGAHIGAGYVQKLDEKSSIDWYSKLLWARLEGGSTDLSTGEHLTFDDADSLRLRIGGRWNYAASDFVSYYAGLGYEYEFDGEASGFTNGLALGDEDLTGGSGVAELGISFKPSKNSPFSLELNLAGFTGEREGFRGGVEAVYTF